MFENIFKRELSRENAREVKSYAITIEDCINTLLDYRKRHKSVFIVYLGHRLYSCDVTVDSAYKEVYGQTKAEFDIAQEKARINYGKKLEEEDAKEKAIAEANIPVWIDRGKKLIYPQRFEDWKKHVTNRAHDLYYGKELDEALLVMEKLESSATLSEAQQLLYDLGSSGLGFSAIMETIFLFSKRGPEFWEYTVKTISPENRRQIQAMKQENAILASTNSSTAPVIDQIEPR